MCFLSLVMWQDAPRYGPARRLLACCGRHTPKRRVALLRFDGTDLSHRLVFCGKYGTSWLTFLSVFPYPSHNPAFCHPVANVDKHSGNEKPAQDPNDLSYDQ
jgi:hypothetical protein